MDEDHLIAAARTVALNPARARLSAGACASAIGRVGVSLPEFPCSVGVFPDLAFGPAKRKLPPEKTDG
jgi:hypothetical protein